MVIATAWNDDENRALVALYFAMLALAIAGRPYNKRAMIRDAQGEDGVIGPLAGRSKGSVEAKLMNATAAHRDIARDSGITGVITMDGFGYRGLNRYQGSLRAEVLRGMCTASHDSVAVA